MQDILEVKKPLTVTNAPSQMRYDNKRKHPVDFIQQNKALAEEEFQMQALSTCFGSHLPMKLTMERTLVTATRRFPGHKNYNVGLEVLMGKLNEIDFEDYLGTDNPFKRSENPHSEQISRRWLIAECKALTNAALTSKQIAGHANYSLVCMLDRQRKHCSCKKWKQNLQYSQVLCRIFFPSSNNKTCLLYTSPSPRDGLLSRMPSSA
eukprot:TRINITY_DN326_c0_g1_i2.p1 TRINITY_DN326_c0_g1~~TRINITY_DN326_c0_g1_i2.p1  ORF type:complete len:207 (+),score=31.31 TRINITY_DN326_c0_g1_i2:104-724(+)